MKAKISLNGNRMIDQVDERIYSSFIEHMGRCVYYGIYEPGHPTADEDGFRKDVMDLVAPLNIPLIRYPGGNFLSGYNWEDGVGPKEKRKAMLDPAWRVIEPNEVGTDDFHKWAKKANTGVMMAVNLGTRGAADAAHLVEYCNFPAGTKYADMRVENGVEEPYNDRVWCIGNEMDGIWQVGHRSPDDYAAEARKTACLMKMLDPNLELVVCGSCSYHMPTFGVWERKVLEQTYDHVEYISLHQYYKNDGSNPGEFLASANEMDKFIKTVTAMCDAVGGEKRSQKKIHLSFDEWNILSKRGCDSNALAWTVAPPREEYIYTLEDALCFGTLLITLIRNCDRVKIACLAQLVNVGGMVMTENNGPAWRQTTYYPFLHCSNFGRGKAIDVEIDCPSYQAGRYGETKYLSSVAVQNDEKGEINLFVVNRSLEEDVQLQLEGFDGYECVEHIQMISADPDDYNTAQEPDKVAPFSEKPKAGDMIELKKASWNVIRYQKI